MCYSDAIPPSSRLYVPQGFPGGTVVKRDYLHVAGDSGDTSLIPGSGRSPGAGNGNPLQYSCVENRIDRGDWWTLVDYSTWGHKELDTTECVCMHTHDTTHTHWEEGGTEVNILGDMTIWVGKPGRCTQRGGDRGAERCQESLGSRKSPGLGWGTCQKAVKFPLHNSVSASESIQRVNMTRAKKVSKSEKGGQEVWPTVGWGGACVSDLFFPWACFCLVPVWFFSSVCVGSECTNLDYSGNSWQFALGHLLWGKEQFHKCKEANNCRYYRPAFESP